MTQGNHVQSLMIRRNLCSTQMEIVLVVEGGDEGLEQLSALAPDGRSIMLFAAPNPSTLGLREFILESPEPADRELLESAYPEGMYQFFAKTASGQIFQGNATLSHDLPPTTTFVPPGEDAADVPLDGTAVSWEAVPEVKGYMIEIEQDELAVNITATLPASSTSFLIPSGFLQPNVEYELGIATIGKNGNFSCIETSFTTGAQ